MTHGIKSVFLQGSKTEQFLLQDVINEQLKIYGIDVYYLPRKFLKLIISFEKFNHQNLTILLFLKHI